MNCTSDIAMRCQYFVVYMPEAYPVDLWQMSSNVKDGVLFASPQTADERVDTAEICVVKLAIKMPRSLTASTTGSTAYSG